MPRCSRVMLPNVPLHAIQRRNNRQVYLKLEPGMVEAIRQATSRNFALGDGCFGEQIALVSGRRV